MWEIFLYYIPEFLKPAGVFVAGSLCLGLCGIIGLFIAITRSLLLLPVGAIVACMGLPYSVPPLRRAIRPVGEVAWFLTVPLIALCAFIVQVPVPSLDALFLHAHTFWAIVAASLPLAFMGACGVFVTEYDADKPAGNPASGVYLFALLCLLSYVTLFADIALGAVPFRGILMLMTAPLMVLAALGLFRNKKGADGIVMPVVYVFASCIVTGLLLILAYL